MRHTALVEYHTDDPKILAITITRINDEGDDHVEVFTGTRPVEPGGTDDDFDSDARAAIEDAGFVVTGERDGVDIIDLGGALQAATWTFPVAAEGDTDGNHDTFAADHTPA